MEHFVTVVMEKQETKKLDESVSLCTKHLIQNRIQLLCRFLSQDTNEDESK